MNKEITTKIHIQSASVKVMRSHDYCHFEVALSTDLLGLTQDEMTGAVDDLRKTAARLADKAVAQYKIAKANVERRYNEKRSADYIREEAEVIENKPETERAPKEQAVLEAYRDHVFEANRGYDYEDD